MPLNESDTRAQLIDPKLEAAGWGSNQIGREHYYRRDVQYTAGRIVLRGEHARHREGRKVDYVLRYTEGFPMAVVEAKAEDEEAEAGFEQAKGYARDTGVPYFQEAAITAVVRRVMRGQKRILLTMAMVLRMTSAGSFLPSLPAWRWPAQPVMVWAYPSCSPSSRSWAGK